MGSLDGYSHYFINDGIFSILIVCSCLLILAIGYSKKISYLSINFSKISFEVYLSHMVIFRLLEKMHITKLVYQNELMNVEMYLFISLLVIVGTIIFSKFVNFVIKVVETKIYLRNRRIYD